MNIDSATGGAHNKYPGSCEGTHVINIPWEMIEDRKY